MSLANDERSRRVPNYRTGPPLREVFSFQGSINGPLGGPFLSNFLRKKRITTIQVTIIAAKSRKKMTISLARLPGVSKNLKIGVPASSAKFIV